MLCVLLDLLHELLDDRGIADTRLRNRALIQNSPEREGSFKGSRRAPFKGLGLRVLEFTFRVWSSGSGAPWRGRPSSQLACSPITPTLLGLLQMISIHLPSLASSYSLQIRRILWHLPKIVVRCCLQNFGSMGGGGCCNASYFSSETFGDTSEPCC